MQVEKFLADPFKSMIHKDSPILEEAPRSYDIEQKRFVEQPIEGDNDGRKTLRTVGLVLGVFSLLAMPLTIYCWMYDVTETRCYRRARKHFYKHLVGRKMPNDDDDNLYIIF